MVELFLSSEIGEDIAILLTFLIPECKYAEVGKKIVIKDMINPHQIPGVHHLTSKTWGFLGSDNMLNVNHPVKRKDNKFLFFDDEYVVEVEDDEVIVIWVFKYPIYE